MVVTITPAVAGGSRARYLALVGLHALAAGVAAALAGALLGAAGGLLGAPWGHAGGLALAGVALLYGARELVGLPVPLPQRRAQVPEWWRPFFSPPAAALLYGLGLGPGFLTYLSFGTLVAVAAGAVSSGDPLLGAALCAPFGLARGLSVVVGAGAPWRALARLEELAATSVPRWSNGVALLLVALVTAAA
jgi:hypothetical protein